MLKQPHVFDENLVRKFIIFTNRFFLSFISVTASTFLMFDEIYIKRPTVRDIFFFIDFFIVVCHWFFVFWFLSFFFFFWFFFFFLGHWFSVLDRAKTVNFDPTC
jgi:hypothetical protein